MSIKTILLDLGNVVVAANRQLAYSGWANFTDLKPDNIRYISLVSNAETEYELGAIDSEQFYQRVRARCKLDLDIQRFFEIWNSSIHPIQGSEEFVNNLKNHGYTLVAVSNTNPAHIEHLVKTSKLLSYFDYKVFSYLLGFCKNSTIFFTEAQRLHKTPALECLLIDDIPENIETALKLGINSILHTSLIDTTKELKARDIL